jgi:hypothetical protein
MTFLLVTLGLAIGFAYVLVEWFRVALRPLADLLAAARPLLIPVLVVVATATVNLALWVSFLAAILLVVVGHRVVVRPELARLSSDLGQWWHVVGQGFVNAVTKGLTIAVPAVVAVWIAFLAFFDGFIAGQGGLAAASLLVALVAVVVALGVRLFAFATTLLRTTVSVLLGAAVVAGFMGAGVLCDCGSAVPVAGWLVLAAGAALAITIVIERVAPPAEPTAVATLHNDRARAIGLSLALLSGILLVLASASSLWQLDHQGGRTLSADRGAHETLYTDDDNRLEYRYAPVLAFNTDQKWTPTEIGDYVARADVVRKDGSQARAGHYECSSLGPRSCLRVTVDCATAAMSCAHAIVPHAVGDHVSDGAIYVRVLRRPQPHDPGDDAVALRGIFRSATPTSDSARLLLQYWFFYPYDEWTSKVLGARLTQRHEGDWESVTVGLGDGNRPLFVAYSAHCGGTWRRWNDTHRFGTHPLVAVAKGSQANYSEAGAVRPPDFTSCKRLPRGIGTLLAFAANVRDVTSDDWQWGAAKVLRVTENDWPMSFPGTWGAHDVTEFENLRTFTSRAGGGPASPPLQVLWQEPVRTIFCDRYWNGPEPCKSP